MRVVEKEARTKEEAVRLALEELGAGPDEVKIETIESGKKSFLGLGQSKPARVRVYLISGESEKVVSLLQEILEKMGIRGEVSVEKETDQELALRIDSPDSGILIGRKGKTLESLQYLINVLNGPRGERGKKILLDTARYKEKREDSLKKLALHLAHKVIKNNRPYTMKEMNPYERRIVHMTLENMKDIQTESIGHDKSRKKIKIMKKESKTNGQK